LPDIDLIKNKSVKVKGKTFAITCCR